MMPKGVEHGERSVEEMRRRYMDQSMMPKGVEHLLKETLHDNSNTMDQSMMPKGVEHSYLIALCEARREWINL